MAYGVEIAMRDLVFVRLALLMAWLFAAPALGQALDAPRQLCTDFGYQSGTVEFAQCVERSFRDNQQQDQQRSAQKAQAIRQACDAARQEQTYWCDRSSPRWDASRGVRCVQAEENARKACAQ
jgi:hypothetical protein